jgi:hypothetical protein
MSQLQVDRINDASGGVLAPISSVMRNRLIDAGFIINQRGYVSGTALASGVYAHDRWKAGASGCTYTFTQGSAGVPIVITITAGSLQQVIEGANMPEGGTYVLSWTGTAQARFNGGTYSNSPLAVTGITAGANTTIEFSTGTCSFPQLEKGTQATSFEYRQYGQELALCQRFYEKSYDIGTVAGTATLVGLRIFNGTTDGGNVTYQYIPFRVEKRATPTMTAFNASTGASGTWIKNSAAGSFSDTLSWLGIGTNATYLSMSALNGNWQPGQIYGHYTAAAEL